MIEALRAEVNKEIYGEPNVTVVAATPTAGTQVTVKVNSLTLPHRSRIFEIKDGDAKIRIVAPDDNYYDIEQQYTTSSTATSTKLFARLYGTRWLPGANEPG